MQVPVPTQNINDGESKARRARTHQPLHLKGTRPLIVIHFSYLANLFAPPGSFLTLNACDTSPTTMCVWGGEKKNICEDMQRYACRDLVCKDHKRSCGVNGKAQRGGMTHRNVSLFNLSIIFDRVSRVSGGV